MRIAAVVGIHLVVPFVGVAVYVWLCGKMKKEGIQNPPFAPWFILFATYGAWLAVILTGLFWEWSGMASLGLIYLLLPGPFVTAVTAFLLRHQRSISAYHRNAFRLSFAYSCVMAVLVPAWLVSTYLLRDYGL